MKTSRHPLVKIIFILALVFMVILSVFSYVRIQNLINSSEWVIHTNNVKLNLTNILSAVTTLNTYQRGYIISKDSIFLNPYDSVFAELNAYFDMTHTLTQDNKIQKEQLNQLKTTVFKHLGYLESISSEADSILVTREKILRGKILMDDIRLQVDQMLEDEDKLLKERNKDLNREILFSPLITVLLFLSAIFFILIAYIKIMRDLKESQVLKSEIESVNQILVLKNEELKKSEEHYLKIFDKNPVALTLAEIGTNIITYANENFIKAFGFSKEEVLGSTSESLKLVSEEENARLIALILDHLNESRSLEELQQLSPEETEILLLKLREQMFEDGFEVEYTRKDGSTFFALVFFEIISIGNKKYTISSYQDISERKKAAAIVAAQNEELVRINKELESFNYISSHDLQEPLRKIQIFSNRILESESQNLSSSGREYFDKIQKSGKRMQNLIRDLLSYSKVGMDVQMKVNTPLSDIVKQVILEQKELLDEKNAKLEIGHLDKIPIIPFQFHQLLTNLITNALKFVKEETIPTIHIESLIGSGAQFKMENLQPRQKYCRIIVKDNGIGFEQEYADRIFEVFRQLNPKGKFEGSGIGLSIVKKIVDNHNGFVLAKGKLGEGAEFQVYLPV